MKNFNLVNYCNQFPEKTSERCGLKCNLPCMSDEPKDYPFHCGKCPFIQIFSTALVGKYVKYVDKDVPDFTLVGYCVNQCPEGVYIVSNPNDDHVIDDFPIDPESIIDVMEEEDYKESSCTTYDCESCILKYCCTSSKHYYKSKNLLNEMTLFGNYFNEKEYNK